MNGKMYGYVRVSTREQNEGRQLAAMSEFGVPRANLVMDRQSGKDFERPGYKKLIRMLCKGDVLVIQSIDRLGRNYREIMEQWRTITKDKGAAIVVLDMPLLDTRAERDLAGTLISDIVLQLLSYVAQTEREFIRKRQAEGIAVAKARGACLGRRAMEIPDGFKAVFLEWQKKRLSANAAAKKLGVSRNTFLKWAREGQKETGQKGIPF